MLFCARFVVRDGEIRYAWEGFAGLGGFFGDTLTDLSRGLGSKAAGTYFANINDAVATVADTVVVMDAQQCFIAGNSSTLRRPKILGPHDKPAFDIQKHGILQIDFMEISGRTTIEPAGMRIHAAASASISQCSFLDLHTTGSMFGVIVVEAQAQPLTIRGTVFQRCGPVTIWTAVPLFFLDGRLSNNGQNSLAISAGISCQNSTRVLW